jgi:hypothetical protein
MNPDPESAKDNILEVTMMPTAEEVEKDFPEDDFVDEEQRAEVVGREQGAGTDSETVSPGEDFNIEQGYRGSISIDVPVIYPQRYSENEMGAEEGTLDPGVYHWDGKVITFKGQIDRS